MEIRELTCISCPLGCPLKVCVDSGNVTVTGNTCPRGAEYGKKEVLSPVRTVTSTVLADGGAIPMVSVKTECDIPKDKIFACMEEIRKASVKAPVTMGETVIADCAGTGVSVVATKAVERA